MDIALVAGRIILALVFLVAGLAKLADPAGSRKSMTDFGVPASLSAALGFLLPVGELVIAIALLPAFTAWWGTAGALALLLLFIAGISVNLARGRAPDCHCFGQLHSAPIGWKTLTRNVVLSAVAVFVLWQGKEAQPTLLGWTRMLTGAGLALFVVGSIVMALLVLNMGLWLQMMRQSGRLLLRIEALEKKLEMEPPAAPPAGLPVGSAAPAFSLSGLEGEEGSLEALRAAGKPVLLFFTDPDCGPCDELLPEIAGWQKSHAGKLTLALITGGEPEKSRSKMKKHGLKRVLLQKAREMAGAYECSGTPGAVLVGADGMIASHVAMGADAVRSLVAHATRPEPAKMGEPAPAVRLPDLKGRTVDLEEFRGPRTLVLFWNPACGFCQQMLEELKTWERKPPGNAPKLVVISTGTVEENRAQGFLAPILLDKDFGAGWAFGAGGTPSAVLLAADGKIASQVAVGTTEVLELFGVKRPS